MASSPEFVEYIVECLSCAGSIRYRKMMGEYCLYLEDKVIGMVCDNSLYIKKTKAGVEIYPEFDESPSFPDSNTFFLVPEFENQELMRDFLVATYNELSLEKKKNKRCKSE